MKGVAAALLVFEAITVLLASLLALTSTDVSGAVAWSVFGGLVVLCFVGAATIRRGSVGLIVGSGAQVGAVASGLLVPAMFFLGALFGGLWVLVYVLGQRLDAMARAPSGPG